MRKFLHIWAFALLPCVAMAWSDSLVYLRATDTVFLELSELHEKIITHKIKEQETLYALSRFYGMTVQELFYYNPALEKNTYDVGQQIYIPVPSKAIVSSVPPYHNHYDYVPVCYRVRKSETLFRIAKRYFGIPIDTIAMLNRLTTSTLSVGQVLQIGWLSRWGIPHHYRKFRGSPIDKKNQLLARKYYQARTVKKESRDKGVAFWQNNGVKSVDLYAMHRTAPLQSIIAVNNPMNRRTVYAKVIARLPDTVYSDDVVVVVSARVAQLLGAKDQRFYVKIKYLK